jgi:hypothetical protein
LLIEWRNGEHQHDMSFNGLDAKFRILFAKGNKLLYEISRRDWPDSLPTKVEQFHNEIEAFKSDLLPHITTTSDLSSSSYLGLNCPKSLSPDSTRYQFLPAGFLQLACLSYQYSVFSYLFQARLEQRQPYWREYQWAKTYAIEICNTFTMLERSTGDDHWAMFPARDALYSAAHCVRDEDLRRWVLDKLQPLSLEQSAAKLETTLDNMRKRLDKEMRSYEVLYIGYLENNAVEGLESLGA